MYESVKDFLEAVDRGKLKKEKIDIGVDDDELYIYVEDDLGEFEEIHVENLTNTDLPTALLEIFEALGFITRVV